MQLNDLLEKARIDPKKVIVMRHRPSERRLNKVLPWMAAEQHDVFNTYQSFQGRTLERGMSLLAGNGYVASFLGRAPGTGLFVGLYEIRGFDLISREAYESLDHVKLLFEHGMGTFSEDDTRKEMHHFQLAHRADFYGSWKGRLVVSWPPPERSWWRRAHRNEMQVLAVLEESALSGGMPRWSDMAFTWKELSVIPQSWTARMEQWRCIYFIKDTVRNMGYVGSAYGQENLIGRWQNYRDTGHGDNKHLKDSGKENLVFTILQRLPPDMAVKDVVAAETSWKRRLDTAWPRGLNGN